MSEKPINITFEGITVESIEVPRIGYGIVIYTNVNYTVLIHHSTLPDAIQVPFSN